jgi:lysophospholipase L1-like esterase
MHTAINNASTTVAVARNSGVTSLTVANGAVFGSSFPVYVTAVRSNAVVTILEITGRSGNVLTVTGGVDGSTDAALQVGDTVECRDNAGLWTELQTQVTANTAGIAGKQAAGNYLTALTGDVAASGPGSAAATVARITATTADAAAPDGSIFLGSDHSDRPCWKDSGGTVHLLSYADPAAAPTLTSATVAANGTTFTVVLTHTPTGHAGFTLQSDGGQVLLTYVSGDGTGTLVYSTDRTVYSVETLTLDYAPGDITTGTNLAAFTAAAVTNSSTQTAPSATPAGILCDGDSLTFGSGAVPGTSDYVTQLQALLPGSYTAVNLGVNGQRITDQALDAATQVTPQLATYTGNRTCLVAWGDWINELIGGMSGTEVYRRVVRYCRDMRLAGWDRLLILDATPITAPGETGERATANSLIAADFPVATSDPYVWLRQSATDYACGLVKLHAIANLQDPTNATYYADGIHLTAAGYAIVAAKVNVALPLLGILPTLSPLSDYGADTFTGANGDLTLHSPTYGGGWWAQEGSAWVISSNKAALASGAGPAILECYHADGTITLDFTPGNSSYDGGLAFNFAGVQNIDAGDTGPGSYWVFRCKDGADGIYKMTGGSLTLKQAATTGTLTPGTTYALTVLADGDNITAKVGGTTVAEYTETTRPFKLGTFHGPWSNGDTLSRFDNFLTAALPAPPPADIYDSFTGANGTGIATRPTDSGHTWTLQPSTAWQIQSNRCVLTTATFTIQLEGQAYIDAGQSDRLITCVQNFDSNHIAGVIFRRSDQLNYWIFYFSGFTALLQKCVAGTFVNADGFYFPYADVRNVTITCEGDDISATVDGAGGGTAHTTDSFNNTATQFGIRDTATGYGGYFDDFRAGPLP